VPMATLCRETLCATFSGLSKVYRACGYRVGWVAFSGALERAERFLSGLDLLAALRLCSNVPGQWAVQTALGGYQSIRKLCSPGGRLYESRRAIIEAVERSPYLSLVEPRGSMYAFIAVDKRQLPGFDDEAFAMELLEQQHVLVAPGSSFNTPFRDHFRITSLPDEQRLTDVFRRIDAVLEETASRPPKLESML
ncbi:MAG TPA: aminotransferase class I/II-fold pyridoxal phosphate-dependent enzyme, partial [Gammaproteobacteria bacterium]|nr:aminotransferase class I/II-fold pyridoxal phosphate-dependent enzyme [Gammaproteobacteria bacterium]